MAYKSLSFLVLFVLASLLSASIPNEAAPGNTIGIWQPIDPKDPEVVKIADFAVKEHNKEAKTALVFKSVVKAEEQVAGNTYYRLEIAATEGGAANPKNYIALVLSKSEENALELAFFEPIQD